MAVRLLASAHRPNLRLSGQRRRAADHVSLLGKVTMKRCLRNLVVLCSMMALADPSLAVGGKWTPQQLLQHDRQWLADLGLEVPPQTLWDASEGGLLEAIVQLNGCSAGFLSERGLAITNHHCAFGMLQEHSVGERDIIRDGFLAQDPTQELPGSTAVAIVPHRFTDVTAEIEASVPEGADDLARFRAIDRRKKEMVASCEATPFRHCRVDSYDDGVLYVLSEALEFRDVRLVYAPPRAVGEYGGEVDNWMWPRHTGDVSLLRVYADAENRPADYSPDNRPFRPSRFLKIAEEGVEDGDFVMVAGYPFRTYRSLVAAEMAERAELYFPQRSALYRRWMDIMEASAKEDPAAENLLSSRLKGLANREKNSRGQVKGIERGRLLQKKRQMEAEVLAWAAERPEHSAAVAAQQELSAAVESWRETSWQRDFLLDQAPRGPLDLQMALTLTRWAQERPKADLERHEDYQERRRDSLLRSLTRNQKQRHSATEERLLHDLLQRFVDLPEPQRVAAVEQRLGQDRSPDAVARLAAQLMAGSRVGELEARTAMFEESLETLRARHDSLLDFAFDLGLELKALEEQEQRQQGLASRLRPTWRRAFQAHLGRPIDPDANGTLRVSLAHVKGYHPRDGIFMEPQTRLAGVVEKHTGEEPFKVPAPLLAAAPGAAESRWADAGLGDVPICFLADGDTTGGSSGSPVINGRGELVGVNFDRVWENIANDFGYNPDIARNVSVDIRYLLWTLEVLESPRSGALLEELGFGTPMSMAR